MNLLLLENMGEIQDKLNVLNKMRMQSKKLAILSDRAICRLVNDKYDKRPRYFTKDYFEIHTEDGAKYMWVNTNIKNDSNKDILFQFCKDRNGRWKGALVNSEGGIIAHQGERDNCVYILKPLGFVHSSNSSTSGLDRTQNEKESDTYEEIFEKLLIKSDWNVKKLKSYIETLICRINHKIAKQNNGNFDFIIYSIDKKYAIINTGLLDTFGKSILLIIKVHKQQLTTNPANIDIVKSKVSLSNDFDKNELNKKLNRVKFYDKSPSELVFHGNLEDFDLENWDRLVHCINDRRSRFPESLQDATDEVICKDLLKAIEVGVELNNYDGNYIRPCYHRKLDKISFIIPYHINNDFQKPAELGIVIINVNGYWQISTILDANLAHTDIKTLRLYTTEEML
jgi:uncharacterized protein YfkK (UPF0435 family)